MLLENIQAQNKANEMAREIYAKACIAMVPFHGKKVRRSDGHLRKEVRAALEAHLPEGDDDYAVLRDDRSCWRDCLGSIDINVEATVGRTGDGSARVTVCFVDKDGVMSGVAPAEEWRTDYTVAEVLCQSQKIKDAKALIRELEMSLGDFRYSDLD